MGSNWTACPGFSGRRRPPPIPAVHLSHPGKPEICVQNGITVTQRDFSTPGGDARFSARPPVHTNWIKMGSALGNALTRPADNTFRLSNSTPLFLLFLP